MRKLTEIKGDDALELIADMLEPATEIMSDENVKNAFYKKNLGAAIKVSIKEHKKAVKLILALLNGKDVEKYNPSVAEIVKGAMDISNDEALVDLFTLPNQTLEENTSGSASENVEGEE